MQRITLLVLPLLYLFSALWFSAHNAPWGRNVDPEYAYAMNSLTWAAGGAFHKADHPGTTTLLLGGLVIKALAPRESVLEYGAKNLEHIIYLARTVEISFLTFVLVIGGAIVMRCSRLSLALIFQTTPFINFELFRHSTLLEPEGFLIPFTMLGTAIVLSAALAKRPTVRSGVALGVTFALAISSKVLAAPLALIGFPPFLKSPLALLACILATALSFWGFNKIFNPPVFADGVTWLLFLLNHKGRYGSGEPGFIDWPSVIPNILLIIEAAPQIFAVFVLGVFISAYRMITRRDYFDRVSLTLIAFSASMAVLMAATAKHFGAHYMIASWSTFTGATALLIIEIERISPSLGRCATIGAAAVCLASVAMTAIEIKNDIPQQESRNAAGADISRLIAERAPYCAKVSGMFLQDPDNAVGFGVQNALATAWEFKAFVDAYKRVFPEPMFEQGYYVPGLHKYFRPYSYRTLSQEYPCIVVRNLVPLTPQQEPELFALQPEICKIGEQNVYAVGISCATIVGTISR